VINTFRPGSTVYVSNRMQTGYSYKLVAMPGRDFDPRFTPVYSPARMLAEGVFEGVYMRDCALEYPAAWFKHAKFAANGPDPSVNLFKVKSRTPLSNWIEQGWIHPQDPRGWFEWYCRYWLGRRTADDYRQISRWRSFARHAGQVRIHGMGDPNVRPRQRQALLQWAHDPFPDRR
jgi:hypothetical protein